MENVNIPKDEEQKKIFAKNLNRYIAESGKQQKEIAKALDFSPTTFNTWCMGKIIPGMGKVQAIADYFGILKSDLLENKTDSDTQELSELDKTLLSNFHALDAQGQSTVLYILDNELKRLEEIRRIKKTSQINSSQKVTPFRKIQKYVHAVSAGTGEFVFDDIIIEDFEIPDISKYQRVAYAISVKGNSMEPKFFDGDTLLVEPTNCIDVGEIGIFIVDGKSYVKKLGEQELISLNKDYANIPLTENSVCQGRIIGRFS